MLKILLVYAVLGISLICVTSEVHAADKCIDFFTQQARFSEDRSFGQQIFMREFGLIQDSFRQLNSLGFENQLDSLIKQEGRRMFFHLRILAQSYESLDPKFFGKKVRIIKRFERLLGQVELYGKLRQRMVKTDEPKLADLFSKKKTKAAEVFQIALQETEGVQDPVEAFQKLSDEFEHYSKWPIGEADRKFLLVEAIHYARGVSDKINKNGFDSDDLEKGLHNLRRRLREFTYRIASWEGFVQFVDEGPLPHVLQSWYQEMSEKNPKMGQTPLLPISTPEVRSPILVAKKLEMLLIEIVADIGTIKVDHESLLYIENVINNGPYDEDTKVQMMTKFNDMRERAGDQRESTNAFQQRLRESHLLEAIIAFLESQI